ncbi:MAG: hypothetical protein ABSE51_05235 [Terracidiphilus sp.]|jgi:hypothetical protein
MEHHTGSPAKFKFEDRFLFIIVPLFVLLGILDIWGFHYHHLHPTGALAYMCAFLYSMPMIAFIVVLGLYLAEETDDFMRALWVQSILWGIGATLAIANFCGASARFGLDPHLGISSIQFVFLLVMIFTMVVIKLRYR